MDRQIEDEIMLCKPELFEKVSEGYKEARKACARMNIMCCRVADADNWASEYNFVPRLMIRYDDGHPIYYIEITFGYNGDAYIYAFDEHGDLNASCVSIFNDLSFKTMNVLVMMSREYKWLLKRVGDILDEVRPD